MKAYNKLTAASIIAAAPVEPVISNDVAAYKKQVSAYQQAQRAYKASVQKAMKGAPQTAFVGLCNEFRQLPQEAPRDKVRVTTWIKSFSSWFAAAYPGKELQAVKQGKEITGYAIADVSNQLTEKRVAAILAACEGIPGVLTTTDRTELARMVEEAEQNAAKIAEHKAAKALLVRDIGELEAELSRLDSTIGQVKAYTSDVPASLQEARAAHVAQLDERKAELAALKVA